VVDINEKINLIISKMFIPIFKGKVKRKIVNIVSAILVVFIFFLIVSNNYFYAGILNIISLIFVTISVNISNSKKSIVISTVLALLKYILMTLALLTVVLNLELHKIALFFIIYILLIGSISFISREYLISKFENNREDQLNPTALVDILLTICLILSIIVFLQNSVIIIFIILSAVLNTYLLVSNIINYIKNKD